MANINRQKVIIIGGEGTPWPMKNASWVASAGFDTQVLCFSDSPHEAIPSGVRIIQHNLNYSLLDRVLMVHWCLLVLIATAASWLRFRLKTGRNPLIYDMPLADNPISAKKKAQVIDKLDPDIIIAHNLTSTGLSLAKTHTGKKVVIGWGSDYTESFYSSVFNHFIYCSISRKVDLFICASQTSLHLLGKTFSIDGHKLLQSNFVDNQIQKLIAEQKNKNDEFRTSIGIPLGAKIVFSARRFKPIFGGPQGFHACVEIAQKHDDIWFIFIEGRNNEKCFEKYVKKLNGLPVSISKRFIMERGELPFSRIMEIFSISDVFLSLRKKGDMRAATVIQGAAMGVVPVLPACQEWQLMKNNGFEAFLVDPDKPVELRNTILQALEVPKEEIAQRNRVYLESHESDEIYFQRFSTALRNLVDQ